MADKVPQSGRIADGLYIIGFGFVAMYVVDAGECLVAFDAGMRAPALTAQFARCGLDPARVKHVFLTHTDSDHTGGLPALPEAKVYLSRDEVPMVTRKTPRFFRFVFNRGIARGYETLADSQEISIGSARICCITTPGHTAGSMSFLVNDRILIAGDILNLDKGKAVMDRAMINMDNAKRRESILKLARLRGVSTLCAMHSGYTHDFDAAMQAWRS
jgi:glyoxylase-like metal-dependent hydrolase (beta-lactamase superfamily II)